MAKTLMIQGTASNVGKSLIVAGLCRIFKQDGFSTAPFKSQNMALNSFISREGLEFGRAQAAQAEAAGIEPVADMNPILLKPAAENVSQVIIQGEVYETMQAREYYTRKHIFIPKIEESFSRLASAYDIIVIEGAGSPVEINLKENDLVNMFIARLARAPVLLAGDIDRGGVFASLFGTVGLLPPDERALVKGILINKFRGDLSLLESGLRQLEQLTGTPVLGVIPYAQIDIDDEDSLSARFGAAPPSGALLDIAVIKLPRIANFTDFTALARLPEAAVRYVSDASALGSPDILIIPGTKNTMSDLLWLRERGLDNLIISLAHKGTPVFGICGGYQMLGTRISDPLGIEHGGSIEGLGLLPVTTVFEAEKRRTRAEGAFLPLTGPLAPLGGCPIEGYEIHMGRSTPLRGEEGAAMVSMSDTVSGTAVDCGLSCGCVYGCYIHGIFDKAAPALTAALCAAKGIRPPQSAAHEESYAAYKERQYDALAALLRRHIDMKAVYTIMENGV